MSLANAQSKNNSDLYCDVLTCKNLVVGDSSPSANFFEENYYTSSIGDSSGNNFVLIDPECISRYTKIGTTVFFSINLKWASKGSAVAGDLVGITLPFDVKPLIYSTGPSFTIGYIEGVPLSGNLCANGETSGNKLRIGNVNISGSTINAKVSDLSASGVISISGFYNFA